MNGMPADSPPTSPPTSLPKPPLRVPPRWWWPRRLHQQLVWMVSALLVLALSVLGGYTAHEQAQVSRRAVENQAAALARNVAVASANLILTDSLDGLEELVARSVDVGETRSLSVIDAHGVALAQALRSPQGTTQVVYGRAQPVRLALPQPVSSGGGATPRVFQQGDWIVAWHPVQVGGLIGWVRVEHDTAALVEGQRRTWRNTAVVAVLAVGGCAALLLVFLRRPMRALSRARGFARQLADAKGTQLPIESGPQEVVELTESLNEASVLLCQQMILLEDNLGRLQAHEAQLAEQNDQLGAIFRLSPDGLVTFDRQRCVRFVNQAFLSLTGLTESQVLHATQPQLDALLRERGRAERAFAGLPAVFDEGDQGGEPVLLEVGGGARRVLSLSGQSCAAGSVSQVLYVCDVTRQHTLDEMKSEFLSMAAHELRTPMVSIFGFTELMLKREMSSEQRQDLLGRIHRHSQSMVAILNELLDLARIEARRGQDFQFEDRDLAEVVLPVLRDHRPPEGRMPPVIDAAPGPMPVRVDVHKLQQAVLNILSNAYKYSPDGGEVRVSFVAAAPDEGEPRGERGARFGVVIEDHGMGLSPDHVARLGERFFRADKSGNIAGTGLGVSIVKELMDLMGGRIQVVSALGQGTKVTLWL